MEEFPTFTSIKAPPSLKEMAFDSIKESILAHKLKPGAIYSEQVIAKELCISKTPVHQALIDLEARGFVTVLPRKGFQVNVLNEKDIQDMFRFRHALERAVIFDVTPGLTDESIKEIESLNAQAARTRDRIRFLKFDRGFHRYLTSLTQNQYIIKALENIWDLCDWVGGEIFHLKNRPEEAVREHVAVAEMLKKGDTEGAAEAMKEHLRITEMRFHQLMSQQDTTP